MHLFTLDPNRSYRRERIIEGWFSSIWTEKYTSPNTWEATFPATDFYYQLLKEDTLIENDETDEPIVIEVARKTKNAQGETVLKVTGRDLRSWLQLRVASWDYSQTNLRASEIAYNILDHGVFSGQSVDQFPQTRLRNTSTDGNRFNYETAGGELLEDVQNALDDNDLGLRVRLMGSDPPLMFEIYNGTPRPVLFSDRNDTLINTQYVTSRKKMRNVVVVRYRTGSDTDARQANRYVYGNGGSASRSGTDRRAIRLDMTNVDPKDYPDGRFFSLLDRTARAELKKWRTIRAIDGEIPENNPFKYRKDYSMGDLVNLQSDNLVKSQARVVEFTWSIDAEGYRKYPSVELVNDIDTE